MRKGQIFTIDTIVGIIIVISVLSTAYGFSSYYSTLNALSSSNNNIVATVSSAAFAFISLNKTTAMLDNFQNGAITSAEFSSYVSSHLGRELTLPYYVFVNTKENYSNGSSYLVDTFNNSYANFNSQNSFISIPEVVLVSNFSSLCGNTCSTQFSAGSIFPTQSTEVAATNCTVFNNVGVHVTGWTVRNNTPAGSCTITAGTYSSALPNNYLIKAYTSAGSFLGNTTLHILGLDVVSIEAQS